MVRAKYEIMVTVNMQTVVTIECNCKTARAWCDARIPACVKYIECLVKWLCTVLSLWHCFEWQVLIVCVQNWDHPWCWSTLRPAYLPTYCLCACDTRITRMTMKKSAACWRALLIMSKKWWRWERKMSVYCPLCLRCDGTHALNSLVPTSDCLIAVLWILLCSMTGCQCMQQTGTCLWSQSCAKISIFRSYVEGGV